ncbi:hypothetical protein B5M09_012624 [Aphanomyces astaci]|uniref:Uncharacterized protein n=1 Tax=Aphanomyces astaci TaxID=112090 RepID=A0A425DCA4_APHAT|nr:hypothetical protein B5M09_012624 [Aphanomyces astaci]
MVTPTFAAHTDQLVAQIQLLLELPSPTPPTHVDPDPNTDLVDQPGARGASIETSSAGHSLASNLECTFRGLFEALSVSAVSNQALLDRLGRTAEMALREKVEQERGQANTERNQLEERVRGLRTELRTCKRRGYKELATRVENAIQAQLSSMADQVRELDRQQRSHEEEVAKVSTPSSKRPSPGTSTQLTKKARRSDPDAAGPLGASLPPPVDSAYASVVARSPWERYSTTLVSFVPLSWHQLPEWRELDRVLRSFWQKYAHLIWSHSFMTSSGAA